MFVEAAQRLAGLAGALLGWRPDEFWRATPEELAGVIAALASPPDLPPDLAGAPDIDRLMEMFPDG